MYKSKIGNRKSEIENMADKLEETLVEALKQALAEPHEQRLYKSGKLAGLFPGRSGVSGDAAASALREGLLEIVRTETRGKTVIEWVKPTPRGVNFLHEKESPLLVLRELLAVLQANRDGVPAWLATIHQHLQTLEGRLTEETQRWSNRLEALGRRVEEALKRANVSSPQLSDGMAAAVPWGLDALTYLFRRQAGGASTDCPLPELFKAVTQFHAGLTVKDFHDGLRRLHDRGALRLVPFNQPPKELPEPEYALLDSGSVYYFVAR
jgi:hypothetical protein